MAVRERWETRPKFIMAAIGSAIGLGNLWRFPMTAYDNGGGAFLIPYIIALFTAGIPLMILEFALGQRFQKSAPGSMKEIGKGWEIVGWWALGVGTVISIYYAAIMAWCWDYLYYSLTLAWGDDASSFFFQRVLNVSDGPGQLGGISWPVLLGLFITWLCIYFIIHKGVLRVGKVVMITVPLPALLLVFITIRGVTLPGSVEGITYYLTPDFSKLLDAKTWLHAYSQVFFSLTLGFGVLIAYASYLPRRSDVTNNAFITTFADGGFAYFAGFAVFSVLGYFAHTQGVPVSEVVKGGPSLAFVTYPTAISLMPMAVLIGVFFFLTLLTLGIDSAFSIVEGIVAGLHDKWKFSRERATMGFCIVGFLLGIIFTSRSGYFWLDIVDHWMNNFGLAVIGLLECIAVGWFLKTRVLKEYVNEVSDFRIGRWWDFLIKYLTPAALIVVLTTTMVAELREPYGGYPMWTLFVGGWGIVAAIIVFAVLISRVREEG